MDFGNTVTSSAAVDFLAGVKSLAPVDSAAAVDCLVGSAVDADDSRANVETGADC